MLDHLPLLSVGDTIGLIAPSDYLSSKNFSASLKIIESWGLKYKLGRHIFENTYNFSAGTPKQRQEDLKDMIYNPQIKAIWALQGGYAAMDIVPLFNQKTIDYLAENFKLFIGSSDICTLLNIIFSEGIPTIHGPNFANLSDCDATSLQWLYNLLFANSYHNKTIPLEGHTLISGHAKGKLFVSNSDILIRLFGTKFDPLEKIQEPIILGLEETHIPTEDLIRSMDQILNHKNAEKIHALIIGRLVQIRSSGYRKWDKNSSVLEKIISRLSLFNKKIPLVQSNVFGHSSHNLISNLQKNIAFPCGIQSILKADSVKTELICD